MPPCTHFRMKTPFPTSGNPPCSRPFGRLLAKALWATGLLSACLRADPPLLEAKPVADAGPPIDSGTEPPPVRPPRPPPITTTEAGPACKVLKARCEVEVLWKDDAPSAFLAAAVSGATLHGLSVDTLDQISWLEFSVEGTRARRDLTDPNGATMPFAAWALVMEDDKPVLYFPHFPEAASWNLVPHEPPYRALLERSNHVLNPWPMVEAFFPKALAMHKGRAIGVSPESEHLLIAFAEGYGERFEQAYDIQHARSCLRPQAQATWIDESRWVTLHGGSPACGWTMQWGDSTGPTLPIPVPGANSDAQPRFAAHEDGIAVFRHFAAETGTLRGFLYDFAAETARAEWRIHTAVRLPPRFMEVGSGESGPFVVYRQPKEFAALSDELILAPALPESSCARIEPVVLSELPPRRERGHAVAVEHHGAHYVWYGDDSGAQLIRAQGCTLDSDIPVIH